MKSTPSPWFSLANKSKRLILLTLVSLVAVPALLSFAVSANRANRAAKARAEQSANAKSVINPLVQDKQNAPAAAVTVQTAGLGKPYFNFRDGQQMRVAYRGDQNLAEALQAGQAQPRSLASIVLAADAVPDLIAGYAWNGVGIVTVQHGNPEAFAPKDDSVFLRMQQGYNPDSLLPVTDTYLVPGSPDFLEVGDFNYDNRKDVLVGTRGGGLYLLSGDGRGALNAPEQISLPGIVTTVATGEFRAADGWPEVAIGVDGPSGPAVLIFDGRAGLAGDPMRVQLNAPASAMQIERLDNDPFRDIAVAVGDEIDIIHGWGRKDKVDPQTRIERITAGYSARDLAVGFFLWNRQVNYQLAVLSDDGTVHILDRAGSDARPFTDQELAKRSKGQGIRKRFTVDVETVASWQPGDAVSWNTAREYPVSGSASAAVFQKSHLSFGETDDILISDVAAGKLNVVHQNGEKGASLSATNDLVSNSVEVDEAPAAFVALPTKLNGYRDLIVVKAGSALPTIIPLAPTATPTVDRNDDPAVTAAGVGAAACTGAANDCSLRGAVLVANANPGSTITIPAGTFNLTIAGDANDRNFVSFNPLIGDLNVNASGTTINGAGSGSSTIQQTTFDRVLVDNATGAPAFVYAMSGLKAAGGRYTEINLNIGGAGMFLGGNTNTTTITNCLLVNNLLTLNGGGSLGGGAINITGGNTNITGTTFGGVGVTDFNQSVTSGGGLAYDASDFITNGLVGTLTLTNSTFINNTAVNHGGGLTMSNSNLASTTVNLSGGTFTGNTASATSGALALQTGTLTVASTTFTNNTATTEGGAIHVGGGPGMLLDGSSGAVTFTGNTAPFGSSVSTAGPVNVSGTQVTIGGSVGVDGGGIWTNNVGSTLNPTNIDIRGGTLNCNNSTMNVAGNIALGPSGNNLIPGSINSGSGTVNIAGNFTTNNTAGTSFAGGTSTWNFNGAGAQSISGTLGPAFNNLTDSNTTQPLSANTNLSVGGSLNINGAGATFAPAAAVIVSGGGTLTGTGTARVTRTGADAFFGQYTITTKTLTNLTVEYIGAAAQTASVTTYSKLKINNASGVNLGAGTTTVNGLLTLQAGALGVGANTLVINNGTSVVTGTLTSGPTGTVNYNQGSAGQNVLAGTYGNLTFSSFTKVLASSGTIGIAGTFNTGGVATGHTITGSTVDFNSPNPQTIPAFNFNNLTSSNTGGRTLVNGGTIGIAGTFTPGGNVYTITNNTMDFNGTGAQTIPAFNYNNLTISGNRGGAAITLGAGTIGIAGTFTPSATNNTYVTTGNIVNFNGGAAQTIPAFSFGGLSLSNAAGGNISGNVTVNGALLLAAGAFGVGTNTLTLNGAASFGAGTLTSAATGTVIYNQGSNGQANVLAGTYGNLTFSNFNKTLASSGTIAIAGVFTPGTATGHTITGSTINFNGAGAQNIPGFTYNNLTSTGAVARTLDPVNTIKIAGVFTPGASIYTITGSTVEYNGGAIQTMPATFTTYNNLTLNNLTSVTGFAGLTVQGLLRVQSGTFTSSSNYNNVQIDLGATMVATAGSTINVSGNWTNNGTLTPSTGTVVFNGNNNTQTLAGSTSFNNLTINHTGTGNVTAVGSTLAATGLMRVQGGTFIVGASTFNNVQIDAGQALAGTSATTINVSGNWTNDGVPFMHNFNTVNFNGGGAQAINSTTTVALFHNFTVNKGGGTLSLGITSLTVFGSLILTAGTFANGTATSIDIAGDWINNGGSFTAGTGLVNFNGPAHTIGGTTPTVFNDFGITSGAVSMTNDNTVNGILGLAGADITVAPTKTLTQPAAGSSTGTFDVNGRVQRNGFVTGGAALSFGNPFNTLQVTAGVAPASVVVDLARSVPTGGQGFPTAVQRTYTITPSAAGFTGTIRLHYLPGELNGNNPAALNLWRFDNTLPTPGWRPNPATSRDCAAGCTTNNSNFWAERTGVTSFSPWTLNSTVAPTAAPGVITGRIVDDQSNPVAGAVVKLSGTQSRKFITDANGYYRFDNVETNGFYTVTPSRANYSFNPAERSFSQVGQATEATFGATLASSGLVDPLDTAEYFVRQHYVDFLNREPDEAGFNFWSDQIIECSTDQNCFERRRENVSAAFFLSIEFQRTGGLVDGLYRASYGARPDFAHFLPDTRTIGNGVRVGIDGWEAVLAANTEAFVNSFVNRAEFHAAYDNLSNADYVDTLISHTGVSFTSNERDELLSGLGAGSMTRAEALRSIAGNSRFVSAKFNETFVMMEYFGYLRRDADASGFAFWLNKLSEFDGNFERAEMVKAFIVSGEYRDRFPR